MPFIGYTDANGNLLPIIDEVSYQVYNYALVNPLVFTSQRTVGYSFQIPDLPDSDDDSDDLAEIVDTIAGVDPSELEFDLPLPPPLSTFPLQPMDPAEVKLIQDTLAEYRSDISRALKRYRNPSPPPMPVDPLANEITYIDDDGYLVTKYMRVENIDPQLDQIPVTEYFDQPVYISDVTNVPNRFLIESEREYDKLLMDQHSQQNIESLNQWISRPVRPVHIPRPVLKHVMGPITRFNIVANYIRHLKTLVKDIEENGYNNDLAISDSYFEIPSGRFGRDQRVIQQLTTLNKLISVNVGILEEIDNVYLVADNPDVFPYPVPSWEDLDKIGY